MTERIKYPRTFHLPSSAGRSSDDKVLQSTDHFVGKDVVITTKMDGENTTLYRDGFHARSIDGRSHPSRDWLARFHATIAHEIPDGWRVCGENVYARHSIAYDDLPSYFLGFSVWNEDNICLSWDDTLQWFDLLGITPVDHPLGYMYRGLYSQSYVDRLPNRLNLETTEGFVVRLADSFAYADFSKSVAKWVRAGHVQTDTHWKHSAIVPNRLKDC